MLPEAAARVRRWLEAERLAGETLTFFQKQGVPFGVASSHFALGLVHAGQGRLDEALAEFEQAHGGYQALGHPWDTANTQYEMALVYSGRQQAGDLDQAKQLLQQAYSTFQDLEAEPRMAKVTLALEQLK